MEKPQLITPEKAHKIKYSIPKSWYRAAGILKHKKKQLEKHISKVSAEWDNRAVK